MKYKILLSKAAQRSIRKLDKNIAKRIKVVIDALVDNPWPTGCRPLTGHENRFRVRVGTYRVVYEVDHDVLNILILRLGPRGDVYKEL